ncbi:NAD(P)-dependent alcohol dehydrogenase [Candidatus Bipolaricaulota bacterium]
MRAVVWTAYGLPDVLKLREVEKPTPKNNEVLIRVCASTVTAGDCEMRGLKLPLMLSLPMRAYFGVLKPKRMKILGQEFAGTIESVGKDVRRFQIGDEVFGISGFKSGGYAEYMCRPEHPRKMDGVMTVKPSSIGLEEAVAISLGGLESLHYLQKANIRIGQKVLIIGAGGSIGTMGVQLAKHFGAEVTAIDSTTKLDMLRSIGADHVIDYTREDFTKNGESYDVIFDVVGKTPTAKAMRCLTDDGIYLMANPRVSKMLRGRLAGQGTRKRIISGNVAYNTEQLDYLKALIEQGKLRVVIDRTYTLEQVAEAHRYVETGQKAGNVVIDVLQEGSAT